MATSQTHLRSISLPSRLPSNNSFESQFEKLRSLKNVNSENIQSGLVSLAKLYNSVQEFTQFSSASQQSIDLQDHLDGSVELIDSCNIIREMIHTVQENVQSLQSAIRRKGIESSRDDITTYMISFRKKMNKNVARSLKTLKNFEKRMEPIDISSNTDDRLMVRVLREASEVTIATFRAILMYLSCPITKSGRWNLVSRLMATKSEACSSNVSEMEIVDSALVAKTLDGQMVQRSFQNLASCIAGLESGLETLYRDLIRCRVTFLNIITDQ